MLELWRSRTLEAQLSKPAILFQVQAKGALTRKMPPEREEEGDIPNATESTTDVSGPEVFQYQKQMHPLCRGDHAPGVCPMRMQPQVLRAL